MGQPLTFQQFCKQYGFEPDLTNVNTVGEFRNFRRQTDLVNQCQQSKRIPIYDQRTTYPTSYPVLAGSNESDGRANGRVLTFKRSTR